MMAVTTGLIVTFLPGNHSLSGFLLVAKKFHVTWKGDIQVHMLFLGEIV